MEQTESQVLTVEEAGKLFGISRALAYRLANDGEIAGVPVLRLGRRFVLSRSKVLKKLEGEE